MTSLFALPPSRAAKADPALVADDERRLAAVADGLAEHLAALESRLAVARQAPGGVGQAALDRDQEVHRLTARLRTLRRFGLDLVLGRMDPARPDGEPGGGPDDERGAPLYVGRLGLTGADGERLVVDWRSPAAAPFFGATPADPMGLAGRRRYRWGLAAGRGSGPCVVDYWDEVYDPDLLAALGPGARERAALDERSAFVASLGQSRTAQMRDVLATLAADQSAAVRALSTGALVVDGGPGTGKTVVALHRAAYLLHADPRLGADGTRRGGLLVVGPSEPYLAYVADVLPSLGEDDVLTATLRDLVPGGASAGDETDPRVAALKADARLVAAVDAAVALYEEPPTQRLLVETGWGDVAVTAGHWLRAFTAPDPGTPHHEAREVVWAALLDDLTDDLTDQLADGITDGLTDERDEDRGEEHDDDAAPTAVTVRRELGRSHELRRTFARAWPVLDAAELVGDLFTVPAYLARCAPHLTREEVRALQRDEPAAWTTADLPLLDAARRRLGDADVERRRRRREAAVAAEMAERRRVVDDLIEAEAVGGLMTQLRHADLAEKLVDPASLPGAAVRTGLHDTERLAGPFAHVVVDEAQELTDAQWQMLLARCPSGSFTVVGDRAQARHGFTGTWRERLTRVGLRGVTVTTLGVNYRTPAEVMAEAEPVIRAVLPDANVPTSVRSSGVGVLRGATAELEEVLAGWLTGHDDGVACVITADTTSPAWDDHRVRVLTPEQSKGLEFDLVVLLDPRRWSSVDTYVAMTRATQQLVVLA